MEGLQAVGAQARGGKVGVAQFLGSDDECPIDNLGIVMRVHLQLVVAPA